MTASPPDLNPPGVPESSTGPDRDEIGTGLRLASTLLWLVGILTVLIAIAVDGPAVQTGRAGITQLALDVATGLVVVGAGMLVRRRRRAGAILAILAWAGQALSTIPASGHVRAPSPLVTIAVLLVAFNWRRLR